MVEALVSFVFILRQCAVSNMADETGFLGGYKVGLISASLCAERGKEGKKNKRDSSFIFESTDVTQPTFVPVKKKVNLRK